MGYGITPNSSHFTGKKKCKRKRLKVRKKKQVHTNKYAKYNSIHKRGEYTTRGEENTRKVLRREERNNVDSKIQLQQ